MNNNQMNGSVDLLAKALRNVFNEGLGSVHESIKGIKIDMDTMKTDLMERIEETEKSINTTNKNTASMVAELNKKIESRSSV